MKERTQEFITETLSMTFIFIAVLSIILGFGYLLYATATETTQIYDKCMNSCERLFQEQKLLDCISTCGNIRNQTAANINS